jgi:integrase/recombinase XerD
MPTPLRLRLRIEDPDNVLWPIMGLYTDYLLRGRYAAKRRRRYTASALHFGEWLRSEGAGPSDIDEVRIGRFLTDHLTTCTCKQPVPHGLFFNRAALNNLLRVLRAHSIVVPPAPDAIELELARFDVKMNEIWGLTPGTRDHRCRIIRRLLREQFGTGPIELGAITRNAIRAFVLGDADWSTSTIRVMGGAVRCYLRYRTLIGEDVAHLRKAVPRPAFWRDTELPEALSAAEVEQLFSAFAQPCPSRRRGYAIVRCLADLGLRSSEVIRLTLDDIGWDEGVIRVPAGKARRSDIPRPAKRSSIISSTSDPRLPDARCLSAMSLPSANRLVDVWCRRRSTLPTLGSGGTGVAFTFSATRLQAGWSTAECQ